MVIRRTDSEKCSPDLVLISFREGMLAATTEKVRFWRSYDEVDKSRSRLAVV